MKTKIDLESKICWGNSRNQTQLEANEAYLQSLRNDRTLTLLQKVEKYRKHAGHGVLINYDFGKCRKSFLGLT